MFLTSSFCQLSNFFFCCWFELLAIIGGGKGLGGRRAQNQSADEKLVYPFFVFETKYDWA
jgi:hypothetical protein